MFDLGYSLSDLTSASSAGLVPSSSSQPLPICAHEADIGRLLATHACLVVCGETGSGKSTQLPRILDRLGYTRNGYKIAVTLPRAIAVTTISARVAAELNCRLGDDVGYVLNAQEHAYSERSRVVFFSESALLLELARDPLLSAFKVCMLDEAHERSVDFDVLLGMLLRLQAKRTEVKLVVSSATLDSKSFVRFLGGPDRCAMILVEGRQFPVHVAYLREPCGDFVAAAVDTVSRLHATSPPGDVLVFLPGRDHVEDAVRQLSDTDGLVALGLHSNLSKVRVQSPRALTQVPQEQMFRVLAPLPGSLPRRKVVLATDVAETGVTVPDVAIVVDSLHAQDLVFDAVAGVEVLLTRPVSRARADQRAGRAGRTRPGKCLRLCTERDFTRLLAKRDEPEVVRADLTRCMLTVKALGVEALPRFAWMTRPPREAVVRALDALLALGALLEPDARLSPTGELLAFLPCGPRLGKLLLASAKHACTTQAVALVAVLMTGGAPSLLAQASLPCLTAYGAREGDLATLVNLFAAFDAAPSPHNFCKKFGLKFDVLARARQWKPFLEAVLAQHGVLPSSSASLEPLLRCVVQGFFASAAQLARDGNYLTSREARPVKLHPSSVLARFNAPPPWICFVEAVLMPERGRKTSHTLVRLCTAVDPRWLIDEVGHFWRRF